MEDRLVVLDTETFGLDYQNDPIIEVGAMIVPLELEGDFEVFSSPVWIGSYEKRMKEESKEPSYVYSLHEKSGLWTDCMKVYESAEDITPLTVEEKFATWLTEQGVDKSDPMVGSSIQFDRQMFDAQMPTVANIFSYRNIDTSSVKELCRRYNPRVYSKLDEITKPKRKHRVIPDMRDTVNELRFYQDNFLFSVI